MKEPEPNHAPKSHSEILAQIWQATSGEAAWQTVADLSRFHRIQASPGYRRAAQWIHDRLVKEGLQAQISSYAAVEGGAFWSWPSFQEWDCLEATLHLVTPESEASRLADFRACPISLIQRSTPFEGEAEVVLLEDGQETADYEGVDVAGKVVLSRGDLHRVRELAVQERGAIGILFDGMRTVDPVRPPGNLAEVRQYTSFWWKPGDAKCFGFVLTPRQGQTLRRLLKEGNGSVRVRATVRSRLYDGATEVVQGEIPGETNETVLIVAHLCHPQPSANDNASGAAAALEAAGTLQSLIRSGELPRPKRTIRFLWLPEIHGMVAYLAEHEGELGQMVAGLNLDMVGEDQGQTGSSWLLERPPDAAASFAPDLLACLRDELPRLKGMVDVAPSHTGVGGFPLYRQAEVPFSGGSDHLVLSDPSVGVPTPMLIQWPDRFYHTSADTPDRTDPHSLARASTLAAVYAYWLATAGAQEATWLGHEMVARFKRSASEAAQQVIRAALSQSEGAALAQSLADLDRRLAYLLSRHRDAVRSLERLGRVECPVADLHSEAEQAANRELAWAKSFVDLRAASLGLEALPDLPPRDLTHEEQEAATLVPVRQVTGPIPLADHLRRLDEEAREHWRQLLKERKGWMHYTLTTLALFWADGTRPVLEIADLVELESGQRDVALLLAYFRLLNQLGFITFR
jgi:aminopeptidase YwaD